MISHANPEDNEITLWLSTQLAAQGYQVWCDKAQFTVGEHFWGTIDPVIRDHAIKIVYVLSRTSNEITSQRGFVKELDLALNIERQLTKQYSHWKHPFVLPIGVDDLPTKDYMIHFSGKNVLPFRNWAEGFQSLLSALVEDRVPNFQEVNKDTVTAWWQSFRGVREGEKREEHSLASNEYPITQIPQSFYAHVLQYLGDSTRIAPEGDCPPVYQHGFHLYSFAKAEEIIGRLGSGVVLEKRDKPIQLARVLDSQADEESREHRRPLKALLRVAWQIFADRHTKLGVYEMANDRRCVFFRKPSQSHALSTIVKAEDGSHRRFLVRSFGARRKPSPDGIPPKKRYYHFGVDINPVLEHAVVEFYNHVVFSDDGEQPWESSRRMHSVRRSFCRAWYNDRWRDCQLAFVRVLTGVTDENDRGEFEIPLSNTESLKISCRPVNYTTDVYFQTRQELETAPDESEESEELVAEDVLESVEEPEFEEDDGEGV